MKDLFFPLAVSFLLLGCALPHKGDSNNPEFNNIAVISVMDAPISPRSNADQVITAEMLNSLKKSQKNSFELQIDKTMVTAERQRALALKDVYLGNRYQILEKHFLNQALQQQADFLLVVHPSPHPQFVSYSPGYGLHCSSSGSQAELLGYFMMSSELWDVKKQQVVSRVQLSPSDLNFSTGKKCKNIALSKDLTSSYHENFVELAKKSSSMILSRSGILN